MLQEVGELGMLTLDDGVTLQPIRGEMHSCISPGAGNWIYCESVTVPPYLPSTTTCTPFALLQKSITSSSYFSFPFFLFFSWSSLLSHAPSQLFWRARKQSGVKLGLSALLSSQHPLSTHFLSAGSIGWAVPAPLAAGTVVLSKLSFNSHGSKAEE